MANKHQITRIVKFNKQKTGDMAKRVPSVSRPQMWKFLMSSKMGNCFKINLASVVAFAPVIFVIINIMSLNLAATGNLPYTSFIGVGFPIVVDALERAFVTSQEILLEWGVFYLPCALFVSCFLISGPIYAARNMIWSEGHFHFSAIFRSFKFNWLNSLIIAFVTSILALCAAIAIYNIRISLFYFGATFMVVTSIVLLAIAVLFLLLTTLYAISITITYNENIVLVYRDALVLTARIAIQNIVIVIFMAIPAILLFVLMNTMFSMLILMLFLFIGFSYMILTWEIFAQYVFDVVDGGLR